MAFKIAYGAGHYLHEPGKRLPAELDIKQTREWTLNDRVARHFAQAAEQYEGVELLRTDDPSGENDPGLQARCERANRWGADFALSIHHNAGANLTNAGGIVAFSHYGSAKGAIYRDAIYAACIAAGGLKGNRAEPTQASGFYVLKYTNMPCVLMEYGFMDSLLDAPVVLQDNYSKLVAYATMEGIAKVAGLKKKREAYSLEQFIREVQIAIGARADGVAGPETLEKTVTIGRWCNSRHAAVLPVQKRLLALGYVQAGKADGIAGEKFVQAVQAFQKDNACWTDGVITKKNKTWRKLLGME